MEALHVIVHGLVQGVGFRWFVQREAQALGLRGYARNLITGEVEVVAEGPRPLLEQLIGRIRTGPRSAHVSRLVIEWGGTVGKYSEFSIR